MEAHSEDPLNPETKLEHGGLILERAGDENDGPSPAKHEEKDEDDLGYGFTASGTSNVQLNLRASYNGESPRLIASAAPYTSSNVVQPQVQKSLVWSPDGSCLITHSYDNALRTFTVLNNLAYDLMADPAIAPLSTLQTGDNITSFAVSPYFHISDPSTTCIFHSTYDQPVQCRNVFEPDKVLASYPLFNPMTEEPMRVYCMAFSRDGRHLLCGSSSHIATFDLTRPGEEPVSLFQTAPGRKAQRRHQLALLRGKVSSMSMSADGLLAVGTFARNIGIFADDGTGECITSFSLESDEPGRSDSGVSMVRWCPGGSYLYAAELNSDVIYMYDIRNTGRCLGKLTGRQAKTAQRVDFDIAPRTDVAGNWDGYNIVSGGTDGIVRVWETPHEKEGDIKHTHEWQAHEETVSGVAVNPWYPMLATSAGQWRWSDEEEYASESDSDGETDGSGSSCGSSSGQSEASGPESMISSHTLSDPSQSRSAAGAAMGWMKIWEA
ncbi:WD40-repeat-containing domain protein [Phyllosticta capitalensis]|uniref:WD40-repeat-containing domain protein n=1 Tax=Phyllosticta capitalensis TaxID=121624 RepID=A0ABR1YV88_9PEZI